MATESLQNIVVVVIRQVLVAWDLETGDKVVVDLLTLLHLLGRHEVDSLFDFDLVLVKARQSLNALLVISTFHQLLTIVLLLEPILFRLDLLDFPCELQSQVIISVEVEEEYLLLDSRVLLTTSKTLLVVLDGLNFLIQQLRDQSVDFVHTDKASALRVELQPDVVE